MIESNPKIAKYPNTPPDQRWCNHRLSLRQINRFECTTLPVEDHGQPAQNQHHLYTDTVVGNNTPWYILEVPERTLCMIGSKLI